MLRENIELKPIPGYPDYEISDQGDIFRTVIASNNRYFPGYKLNPWLDRNGYFMVGLYRNRKMKFCYVARLVATSFIPNPDNLPQVNHLNGIKTDNRVENLEWCTSSENHKHAYKVLNRVSSMKGKKNPNAGMSKRPVQGTNKKDGSIVEFESVSMAARSVSGHVAAICRVCRGKKKSATGYTWKYL